MQTEAEKEIIARSLHDGYLQALAAVSLRLQSRRDMLIGNELEAALAEIKEIQLGVGREYDEVREYARSLAWADQSVTGVNYSDVNARFHVQAVFTPPGQSSSVSCRLFSKDQKYRAPWTRPFRFDRRAAVERQDQHKDR